MRAAAFKPTAREDRIAVLDVLRGFALIGILLANLVSFVGYYELSFNAIRALPIVDRSLLFLIDWLVEGKFYALFSMLFGVGFHLQCERARRHGNIFLPIWYRRMLVLLVIGLLHMYLIWYGDILALYALLGLTLPFIAPLSSPALVRMIGVLLVMPLALHALQVLTAGQPFWNVASSAAAQLKDKLGFGDHSSLQMLTSSDAREVLAANVLGALQRPMSYLRSGRYFQVLGFFLLGLWLARSFLPLLRDGSPLPDRGWKICAVIGLGTNFPYAWIKYLTGTPFSADAIGLFQGLVYHIGSVTLALAYAGALAKAWQQRRLRAGFTRLATLGRMALSCYLSQNLINVLLFYGYGLSLIGQVPFALIPVIAMLILLTQWLLCRWWLQRFEQGPLEYCWRRLTYRGGLRNKPSEFHVLE